MAPNQGGDPVGSILGLMGSHWVQKIGQNRKKLPCPKIRIFDYPVIIDFSQKMEVTVMATNHGGDPLGSILTNFRLPRDHRIFPKNGSYGYGDKSRQWVKKWFKSVKNYHAPKFGSQWVKKWFKSVKNYHAPKFEFSTSPRSSIFAKIRSCDYGAKSRWGPPRVHLGANGVSLGPKNGSKPQKITMPQNSNFRLPHGHRFFSKNGSYGYGAKSRWGPCRVHLGANGVPLGPKNGSKPQKITMPQNSNFRLPRDHRIFPKNGSYGYGDKSRWGPPRVNLDANGVPMGKKMVQKRQKLPCPKIRIFDYPAIIDFSQKMEVTVMATKSRWGLLRVHLGANGVPLGPKNGSKP